ncbi:MAG TPA: hypothetical protein EYH31_00145, partial [Anaerolineae bacterium]|nr:hypothetical protein [Anaerolineae bacterium]
LQIVLLALTLLVPLTTKAQQPVDEDLQVVHITFSDLADVRTLADSGLDLVEARGPDYLIAIVGPAGRAWLQEHGFRYTVDKKATARLQPEIAINTFRDGYLTVAETEAFLQQTAADHPTLARLYDYGDSWEKTQNSSEGHDLWVICLTAGADQPQRCQRDPNSDRPRFFLMASIHARELTTTEVAVRFIQLLVDGYGNDPDITWILNSHEIWVAPQTNPDGRMIVQQGYYQRKNTNNSNGGGCSVPPTAINQYGTDLNRNATFQWNQGGSSNDPCDQTYHGPSAASEPEEQALERLLADLFPDQRGESLSDPAPPDTTGVMISLHSYSNLVLWPWGSTYDPAPNADGLSTLGHKFASYNGYTAEQSVGLYPTSGTTDDHAYGTLGIASYTFELGEEFFQPYSDLEEIWQENRGALLYAAKVARAPYMLAHGPDTLNVTLNPSLIWAGDPVTVTATIDDTDNGNNPLAAARAYMDVPPWAGGTPASLSPTDGGFDSPTETVTGVLTTTSLSSGRHMVYVEGEDANGNRGPVGAAFFYALTGVEGRVAGHLLAQGIGEPLTGTVTVQGPGWHTSSEPSTGAYTLTLPAGTYTLVASASGYASRAVSGVVVSDGVTTPLDFYLTASPPLLLVDDDGGAKYESYYTATLDALGEVYDVYTVAAGTDGPPLDKLSDYCGVLWFTGDDNTTTLTTADQTNLATYLDAGGKLFLSGQDVDDDIWNDPGDFLQNHLHARKNHSYGITTHSLQGLDLMSGLNLTIAGGDGANNQTRHSDLFNQGGSVGIFDYEGSYTYGGVAYQGVYDVVYLSFGFEGISSTADRQAVLDRVLDRFGCSCYWADVNCDGRVDATDVNAVAMRWGARSGGPLYLSSYDQDHDNDIDIADIQHFANQWGEHP